MRRMQDDASSITWSYEQATRLLRMTFHGAWPPPERFQELARALREAGSVGPDLRLLIDVRGAAVDEAPFYDEIRRLITPQPDSPRRRAFLAATAGQIGVCNQLCAVSVRHGLEARLFTSESEAMSWLLADRDATD